MGSEKNHIGRLSFVVMGTTLAASLVCYNSYKPNAYEVFVNGTTVAYVKDKSKVEEINRDIINEINERFKNVKIDDNLTYSKIKASEKALCSDDLIHKNILNTLDIDVEAVEMKCDGKIVGIIANKDEGEKIIKLVGQYYLSASNLANKQIVGIKNKITYTPRKVHISYLESPEKILKDFIEAGGKGSPLIRIESTGTISEKAAAAFSTEVKWTESLKKGQSVIKSKGKNGSKIVEKRITFINGIKTGEKVIKETIVIKPQNAVVLKGTRDASRSVSNSSVMFVPSRGSISSSFGARWGKMHEGIDIAANMGDPIYAALGGKVIYAGWESGYGNVIKLSHSGNLITIYGHCSKLNVKSGQIVKKGALIGRVGSTGNSTGPHLHFEVRLNGKPQNPANYLYNKTES